ncbi:MAG: hypothetical protein WBL96_10320 [Pseudolabrys sp.]
MYVLLIILLVALPYGTAIACGALMQWAGNTISGWSSIGGLALGDLFLSQVHGSAGSLTRRNR